MMIKYFKFKSLPLLLVMASFVLLQFAYYSIFIDGFFPNPKGRLGLDYAGVLPALLAGYYHFETNGLLSIPWFTPSFCGGIGLFAHASERYFNVTQFLVFIFDPLFAIKFNFILFSAIGFWGFYGLMRKVFQSHISTAVLGAGLFMFNNYYAYRMIFGHIGFHSFMLFPLIALLLLWPFKTQKVLKGAISSILAALMFSYMLLSGSAYLVIPTVMALFVMAFIVRMRGLSIVHFYLRFVAMNVLTILICAAKLNIAFAFLENFPRSDYPLPGIDNVFYAMWVPLRSLFYVAYEWSELKNIFTNTQWSIRKQEVELGITIIPLVLMIFGLVLKVRDYAQNRTAGTSKPKYIAAIILLCFVPIAVNFYTPGWNDFLKEIPMVKNSSTMVRWYVMYIPIAILFGMLVFDNLKYREILAPLLLLGLVASNFFSDKSYYQEQNYTPDLIYYGHQRVKVSGEVPSIEKISDANQIGINNNKPAFPVRDDILAIGMSQLNCYEPMFGYKLENFKQKKLLQINEKTTHLRNGIYNMKNPACYVFPEENNCAPGDHFKENQKSELSSFIQYAGFEFKMPLRQVFLNYVSMLSLCFSILSLILYGLYTVVRTLSQKFI